MTLFRNRNSLPKNKRREKSKKVIAAKKGGLITEHHIIPLSRGGVNDNSNKSKVLDYFHKRYHWLFSEMTPIEVLAFLESYFWGGNKSFIDTFFENRGKL